MIQLSSKRVHKTNGARFDKFFRNSISPGKPLRLREGIYKQLKDRDWLFNKFENDTVFLIHTSRAFGIAVKTLDIDWEVTNFLRQKDQKEKKIENRQEAEGNKAYQNNLNSIVY